MNATPPPAPRKRLLDPVERISEILFGLIMALSFTCSLGAAEAGREDVRVMLAGAIGCNLAWGLIDAVIHLLTNLTERARGIALLRDLRRSRDAASDRALIAAALPPMVADSLDPAGFERLSRNLRDLGEPPPSPRLQKDDLLAALGVFFLVVFATFPVVIPFLLVEDAVVALRISNGIALVMLFLAGYGLGRFGRQRPIRTGLAMTGIGVVLVLITLALGG
jgi:VIT1/CCC1 family predicted Fe2+/Mn2+ transporter